MLNVNDVVRVPDNERAFINIGLNRGDVLTRIGSFDAQFRISRIDNHRIYLDNPDLSFHWFTEDCLELVSRGALIPGQLVRIIDDEDELQNISVVRDVLHRELFGNWNRNFTVLGNSGGDDWYSINNPEVGNTRYVFRRANLELVTDNMPEKKAMPKAKVEKEPVKLPTLEEIEAMSAEDVYSKYYSKFKKIIDNELYLTVKYEIKSGKSKNDFTARLKKLFFGESSCQIHTEKQAKQIVINYLKEGADLREKLDILKKITELENKCRPFLKFGLIDEIKARTAILINREHNLLFTEASKKNCEDYFEEAKKNVVGLEELKRLVANIEENFEKIEAQLVEIKKAEQRLEAIKSRLQISYKNDSKKISLVANRKQLLERLELIKDSEKDAIVESIKSYQKDDLISIYAETKKFFKKHKIKI